MKIVIAAAVGKRHMLFLRPHILPLTVCAFQVAFKPDGKSDATFEITEIKPARGMKSAFKVRGNELVLDHTFLDVDSIAFTRKE